MFNLWTPISYNTNVNPFIFNYLIGAAQGVSFGSVWNTNPFSGGMFNSSPMYNFGNLYNPFAGNIFNSGGFNSFGGFNYFNNFNNSVFSTLLNGNFIGPNANIFKIGESKPATETKKSEKTEVNQTENLKQQEPQKEQRTSTSNYIGAALAQNASRYMGYNEADGSYRKFSDSPEWCADFVTYVVKETYKEKGLEAPSGFGNHRTEILKQWSIDNNNFFNIANKSNRGKLIAENVKPGDIMILRENGASHTGFVTKVHPDGTFETVEGNRSDTVGKGKYSPDYSDLSGFIQLGC